MSKTLLAAFAVALLLIGLIAYSMKGLGKQSCEVCVEFEGRTQCRTARGATKEEAIRAATDNACAFLTSGMTDSMRCGRTPPAKVKCD